MSWERAAVLSGLLGGSSALIQELAAHDAVLRAPLPLSRRIGFVQLAGGSGTSTVTAYASRLMAHRRAGMVLTVNASAGAVNVLSYAGLLRSGDPGDGERRSHAQTADDARAGLPGSGSGLYGLDLAVDATAASSATWLKQVTPIARFFDVVCTDWGVRPWPEGLSQVAAVSHVVCLVARADRHAAEQVAALVPALGENAEGPAVVVALVDVGRTGESTPRLLRSRLSVPVLAIPYEPGHAAVRTRPSRDLPARNQRALIRLTAAILQQAQTVRLASPIRSAHVRGVNRAA